MSDEKSDAPRQVPTPRSFFRKAPRLNPDLCKPAPKVRRPNHKGKVVIVTLSDGTTRLYPAARWAKLEGLRRAGETSAARNAGHKFTSDEARKAANKLWKRRKKMYWSGVRQGFPAHRPVKIPTPQVVATRLLVVTRRRRKSDETI